MKQPKKSGKATVPCGGPKPPEMNHPPGGNPSGGGKPASKSKGKRDCP